MRLLEERYRSYLVAEDTHPATVRRHIAALRVYLRWCRAESVSSTKATADDLLRYAAGQQERYSGRTATSHLVALRRFLGWAVSVRERELEKGWLLIPEAMQRYRVSQRNLRYLLREGKVRGQKVLWTQDWRVWEESLRAYLVAPRTRLTKLDTVGAEDWQALREGLRAYLLTRGRSAETVRTYLFNVLDYWQWCQDESLSVVNADHAQVERYYADRLVRAPGAAGRYLSAVRSLYRYLKDSSQQAADPTEGLRIRKKKLQPRQPFDERECQALFAAAETPLERAVLLTLVASGMRKGELLAMQVEDIDWRRRRVLVNGKGMRQRWLAVGRVPLEALREQVDGRRQGPVWLNGGPRPLSKTGFGRLLEGLAERAGVSKVHAHRFRTTFANMFLDAGGDLQSLQVLMGHATIAQTAYYSGFNATKRALRLQEQYSLADRLDGGS